MMMMMKKGFPPQRERALCVFRVFRFVQTLRDPNENANNRKTTQRERV